MLPYYFVGMDNNIYKKYWTQRIRDDVRRSLQIILMVPDVDHAQCKYTEHVHRQRQQKLKEVPVIPTTNAVIYPRTVMIKCLS